LRAPSGEDGENRFGDVGQVMGARHQDDSFAGTGMPHELKNDHVCSLLAFVLFVAQRYRTAAVTRAEG